MIFSQQNISTLIIQNNFYLFFVNKIKLKNQKKFLNKLDKKMIRKYFIMEMFVIIIFL